MSGEPLPHRDEIRPRTRGPKRRSGDWLECRSQSRGGRRLLKDDAQLVVVQVVAAGGVVLLLDPRLFEPLPGIDQPHADGKAAGEAEQRQGQGPAEQLQSRIHVDTMGRTLCCGLGLGSASSKPRSPKCASPVVNVAATSLACRSSAVQALDRATEDEWAIPLS